MPSAKIKTREVESDIAQQSEDPTILNQEGQDLEDDISRQIQLEKLTRRKEFNKTLAQNNEERKKYAKYTFTLTCVWAVLIFVIIFFVGFNIISIPDSVLIALITTTTINFFGFFVLVIKYLFNIGNRKQ